MNFDLPRYVGLNDMVEELARKLTLTRFQGPRIAQETLVEDIAKASQEYLEQRLGPQGIAYSIWREVAGPFNDGIRPVLVFGTTFVPDLVVDVVGKPTLAFCIRCVTPGPMSSHSISAMVGESLVYSHQYPAVIGFLYLGNIEQDYMHLLDREIIMGLWHEHKVRLILR